MKLRRALIRMLRPHQWVKNLFVLMPAVFAKELLIREVVIRALFAFVGFSLAASAIYILNDLVDRKADRVHPVKCHRPIASGAIGPGMAATVAGLLLVGAIGIGFTINGAFVLFTLAYIGLNVAYSLRLKNIAYVDVICIATGFELRVLAGSVAVNVAPSGYLLVVTFVLALFLAFGKRFHELIQGKAAVRQRESLRGYNSGLAQGALYTTGGLTIIAYAAYTLDPSTQHFFQTGYLFLTTLFVAFGIARFNFLIRHKNTAESPTEKMLTDIPFLMNILLWGACVVILIY
ncbi:MAG: decaprenyl-phosphate phosphoribosyltransferase [Myxococcales bacterium]|nr:decaprenyl-phosphate phosphoribosyltransferase [Myxococcales bacterium]MCB9707372.1 decaprenyl-phosphate phosphoribosyltransferase [Myxococcales bacterium]